MGIRGGHRVPKRSAARVPFEPRRQVPRAHSIRAAQSAKRGRLCYGIRRWQRWTALTLKRCAGGNQGEGPKSGPGDRVAGPHPVEPRGRTRRRFTAPRLAGREIVASGDRYATHIRESAPGCRVQCRDSSRRKQRTGPLPKRLQWDGSGRQATKLPRRLRRCPGRVNRCRQPIARVT